MLRRDVYVGASTEVEMIEKKDRVDDAMNATRAAMEEGIITGGGVTYIRAISVLENLVSDNEEEKIGIEIVKKSLEEPIRQLAVNAGLEPSDILPKIRSGASDYGFNFKTEQYEHLMEAGIIDPTKVGRLALENAASVAMMMLTTECVIAKTKEKEIVPPVAQM
jgi:chaperonin GroEL